MATQTDIPEMTIHVNGFVSGTMPLYVFLKACKFDADEIAGIVGALIKAGRYESDEASSKFTITVVA